MGEFGLTDEEWHDFKEWSCIEGIDLKNMREWNLRHGHLLKLFPDGYPRKDIPKMIEIWKENK